MGDSKLTLIEATALLKRAVELDSSRRFTEAVLYYQEGIERLVEVMKGTSDEASRLKYREKISSYLDRAEKLKDAIEEEKKAGEYHEQIQIADNSTGHSFEKIFGRLLDETVTEIDVEDPYIRSIHQVYNFLRFCEMVVKSKAPVKIIRLTTGVDGSQPAQQNERLSELASSLLSHGVSLQLNFSDTLHDREIRFNNGWVIKIGRGLDYFKSTRKFSLGYCDFDLRPCSETTVDIFHKKNMKKS